MEMDLWKTLNRSRVYLDQTQTPLEFSREEIDRFYQPLAQEILARCPQNRREVIAVAGPPGSGKSAFASTLVEVIRLLTGRDAAVLAGLDGWHYPNRYLDSHTIQWKGETLLLRKLKGCPETYDQGQILSFLNQLQLEPRVTYPIYSRELHDPIPAAGNIRPDQNMAILEGNYWLLDEPPWNQFSTQYDLSIFLTALPETLLPGLRERHLRGGKAPEQVEAHLRAVDLPNIERVLTHSVPADVVVYKADSRRILKMENLSEFSAQGHK